jgi:hypothetical protein
MGMHLPIVNWILGCVEFISFTILVNRSPSGFVRDTRGLRQGFPLSPFLFLIMSEALSKIIHDVRTKGEMREVKVFELESI